MRDSHIFFSPNLYISSLIGFDSFRLLDQTDISDFFLKKWIGIIFFIGIIFLTWSNS